MSTDGMLRRQLALMGDEFVVHVGDEAILVAGNRLRGWRIAHDESLGDAYRYDSLDELAFALINFSVAGEGVA